MILFQFREKYSEAYARDIRNLCQKTVTNIEAQVVFTLRKKKTFTKSNVHTRLADIYKIDFRNISRKAQ